MHALRAWARSQGRRHTDAKMHVSTNRLHTLASLCTHTHSCIDTSKQEDTCPSSPLSGTPIPLAQAHVPLWIVRPETSVHVCVMYSRTLEF